MSFWDLHVQTVAPAMRGPLTSGIQTGSQVQSRRKIGALVICAADSERMDGVVDLAYRESGGLEVTLLWSCSDESFLIIVSDAPTGETFAVSATSAEAMDVFRHPFAYRGRAMRFA